MLGIPKAVYKGYDSETEAFAVYGRATMTGEKRILGGDCSDEIPSRPVTCVRKPERQPQIANTGINTKAETKEDDSLEEIIVQCLPVSSSRLRSTVQRASTLPLQQPLSSPSNLAQRSKTVPNLDSRSMPSTQKNACGQKPPASNAGRSRVISVSTNGSTTDEENIPSSPATNVSSTLSPVIGHRFPSSSPRRMAPSRPSPARQGDRGDEGRTGPRFVRGSKSPANTIRHGASHRHQPAKRIVRGSPTSTNRPSSIQRSTGDHTSHSPRNPSKSRPSLSTSGSSQLTYVSDDERPAAGLTRLTGDSDYYTPSSKNSETSDTDSEPSRRVSSSALKRKGKHRAPPSLSSPNQDSLVKESHSSSPPLSINSSPQNAASGPSRKKRRDRYSFPPSPKNSVNSREQTQPQDPGQSLGQDVCCCTGPCPSCHKPRFPPLPQQHPLMFQNVHYPYLYFTQPHMQTGYHLTHYGPPPYPYPYAIPQQTDPLPSISSAQPQPIPSGYPVPHALTTHLLTPHPPAHASPAPAPTSSTPAPAPFTPTPVPSTSLVVNSPPQGTPATKQVPPELIEALNQFYQPPQRSVKIIDPSCDPRSPYSKRAAVPAFPDR